ncbi:MAG: aminodeoxychorismate/anthranilate synthase component II [Muricomes sp.]
MIVLIDNYDSFSYNLYQLIGAEQENIVVIRNDERTVEEIREMKPEAIILSPGPGRPDDAGICLEVVEKLAGEIPILGVCLGHQTICQAFGGKITYATQLMHGKTSQASLDRDSKLFKGMKESIQVARYHSLAVDEETLPSALKVTARTKDGEIMAVEHREYPVYGVQFHPESILTPDGAQIIRNFL